MTGLSDYSRHVGSLNLNIEVAILLHDIDLNANNSSKGNKYMPEPEYNEDYVDMSKSLDELTPPFLSPPPPIQKCVVDSYTNMIGYFYIPILMPLIDQGEPTELEFAAPNSDNIVNGSLTTKTYKKLNYISLVIPKYILLNFTNKVPKGTKFLVAIVNGDVEVQNIHIIGIHSQELKLD